MCGVGVGVSLSFPLSLQPGYISQEVTAPAGKGFLLAISSYGILGTALSTSVFQVTPTVNPGKPWGALHVSKESLLKAAVGLSQHV